MKVYSQPEVLEDHIAPASLILASGLSGFFGNNDPNIVQNINDPLNPTFEIRVIALEPATPASSPQPLFTAPLFSEFKIRTVPVSSFASLFSGERPEMNTQSVLLDSLIGEVDFSSSLTDSTVSLLSDVLSSDASVIDPVESVVGSDRAAALVGLSSEEFERSGGSAFLTSL
jgi:hypothetical protein